MAPKSLFARFVLIIILPAIIAQSIVIYVFYARHWYSVASYTSNMLAREVGTIIDTLREGDDKMATSLAETFSMEYTVTMDKESLPEAPSSVREELQILRKALQYHVVASEVQVGMIRNPSRIWCGISMLQSDQVILIEMPVKPLINPTTYIYILWIVGANILLLIVSLIFSRNQIRSILDLAAATDEYGRGKQMEYRPSGATEIRMAGSAVIRMRDRIEKQLAKRTRMLAMISHDLRTPLTRLKLQLELLDDEEYVNEMQRDIHNMEQMINSYLDFARAEGGEEFQEVDLKRWMSHQISQVKYPDLEVSFSKCSGEIPYKIRSSAMQRVFNNLVSNAQRYATKLNVTIEKVGADIVLSFEDNGPGITDDQKPLVFKMFYRSDESRHLGDDGNVGLGLAICSEIVQGHNGQITLHDSKKLGGLLVRIILPLEC